MKQIIVLYNKDEVNKWLKDNKSKNIADIKFHLAETEEVFMVIYEEDVK